MLKLSTRGRYAVRLLVFMAARPPGQPVRKKEIAASEGITEAYLEQLLTRLKSAGLVRSLRGNKGGFLLAREPGGITVADVVRIMEGPVALVDCLEGGCDRMPGCAVRAVWAKANRAVEKVLAESTIEDLARETARIRKSRKQSFQI